MVIQWNQVTWYSKLISAIVLLGILPILFFQMGKKYGEPLYITKYITQNITTTSRSTPVGTATSTDPTEECGDLAQQPMNQCMYTIFKKIDGEMNSLYNLTISKIEDKDALKKVKDVQKSWVTYRDVECSLQSSVYEGGSIAPTIDAQCRIDITRERIKQLQNWFDVFSL
jgi:uncharacterized protein YecT (DUF1311 family)